MAIFNCKFEITNGQYAILFLPDVFVPEFGMGGDELLHQSDTLGAIDDFQLHSTRANVILGPLKRAVLANDDPRDVV